MSTMPPETASAALGAAVSRLEAERLIPVPRASHAVAVDVDDLALLLHHLTRGRDGRGRPGPMSSAAAAACSRLQSVVRCHATSPGPAW